MTATLTASKGTAAATPLRVCVVSEYALFTDALALLLPVEQCSVLTSSNLAHAQTLVSAAACDVVLVAVRGFDSSAADMVAALVAASHGRAKVVAVSSINEPWYVKRLLDAGADGFVSLSATAEELWTVMETVITSELALDSRSASRMVSALRSGPQLSPRELELIEGVVAGLTNDQLASSMFVSRSTVASMLQSVCTKLNVPCRTTAAVAAVRLGLVA